MCSSALFGLLARFVGLKAQSGGLENEGSKTAARDLLTSFVRVYDLNFSIKTIENENERNRFYLLYFGVYLCT